MLTVPTLTLLICMAISWTVLRSGLRGRLLFDAVAFLPHAVPHLILAIAAMFATLFLVAQCFFALRQPDHSHFCLHRKPDQLCHAHSQ